MVNIRDYLVSFDLSKGHSIHTLKRKVKSKIYGSFSKGRGLHYDQIQRLYRSR